jgi:hypothetical protein
MVRNEDTVKTHSKNFLITIICLIVLSSSTNPWMSAAPLLSLNSDGQLELFLSLDRNIYQVRDRVQARLFFQNISRPVAINKLMVVSSNPDGGATNNIGFTIIDSEGSIAVWTIRDYFVGGGNAFVRLNRWETYSRTFELNIYYGFAKTCSNTTPEIVWNKVCSKIGDGYTQRITSAPGVFTIQAIFVNELNMNTRLPTWKGKLLSNIVQYTVVEKN